MPRVPRLRDAVLILVVGASSELLSMRARPCELTYTTATSLSSFKTQPYRYSGVLLGAELKLVYKKQ